MNRVHPDETTHIVKKYLIPAIPLIPTILLLYSSPGIRVMSSMIRTFLLPCPPPLRTLILIRENHWSSQAPFPDRPHIHLPSPSWRIFGLPTTIPKIPLFS
jgi:hypothetical protein